MYEQDPTLSAAENDKRAKLHSDLQSMKEILAPIKRRRFGRALINAGYRAIMTYAVLTDPKCRTLISTKEGRRALFHQEERTGLLEDAILQGQLYAPGENGRSVEIQTGDAGEWTGYDFHRRETFGKDVKLLHKGRKYAFILDDIAGKPPTNYTPIGAFSMFDLFDLLCFDMPSTDELCKQGLLFETNYRDAYKKVGLYNSYGNSLEIMGVANNPVFQVTPKGNGLIFLGKEGGTKEKLPEGYKQPIPIFGLGNI